MIKCCPHENIRSLFRATLPYKIKYDHVWLFLHNIRFHRPHTTMDVTCVRKLRHRGRSEKNKNLLPSTTPPVFHSNYSREQAARTSPTASRRRQRIGSARVNKVVHINQHFPSWETCGRGDFGDSHFMHGISGKY